MNKKIKICISLTEYAKIKLTEAANAHGMNLSNYIEWIARSRTGEENEKRKH